MMRETGWYFHQEGVNLTDGKEGVENELRLGLPSTCITPDNIERVLQMIVDDYPDLAPVDFFLFPSLNLDLKAYASQTLWMMLRGIPQESFFDSFQQL
ncbi:hypothetical protein C0J52_21379 [Blattella germanica]|nr:hypothetical protein C0J52_21379 [Blattella germanica]